MTAKSSLPPHLFVLDPDLGADIKGRGVCATCHLPGEAGDARHTLPDVPEQAEHRRRVGDGGDG